MKKLYIKPKSKVHHVGPSGQYLDMTGHLNGGPTAKVYQLDMLGKDRGDYDDEDYEDVW